MHCVSCHSPVPPGSRYCTYCGAPVKPTVWRPAVRLLVVAGLAGVLVLAGSQVYNGLKREHRDAVEAAARASGPTSTIAIEGPTDTSAPPTTAAPVTASPATPAPTPAPPPPTALATKVITAASIVAPAPTPAFTDACKQTDTFEVAHLQDGDFSTAYRVNGSGVGRQIRFRLAAPTRITQVGLVPGWAKVDGCDGSDLFRQHRTVARVRWIFDGGKIVEQAFNAAPDLQVMPVDVMTKNVTVQILATNAPNGINMTAISEVRLTGVPPA